MTGQKGVEPQVTRPVEREEQQLKTYSPLQMMFLTRLERLSGLRDSYDSNPDRQKWLSDAISRAIYSTYMDCIAQGVKSEADAILRRAHQTN